MRFKKWARFAFALAAVGGTVFGVLQWQQWNSPANIMRRAVVEAGLKDRARLAFQSIEERLPKGRPIPRPNETSRESEEFWSAIDRGAEKDRERRTAMLRAFHEKTQQFFVEREGFGSWRMKVTPEDVLRGRREHFAPDKQPGAPAFFPLSPGETLEIVPAETALVNRHSEAVLKFIHADGFGYMTDRRHVSGFLPHGFLWGWQEGPKERYRVEHLLLVGLLMHENPVVYLSEELPSMKQARQAEVRPLDLFEGAGLKSLARGGDLYIIQKDDTLRMLGALRATKQCLACHDAESGDLLGAFSYTLRARLANESP